eukprot:TRINITY_DN1660_c0_g1_i1.p1 TRINITY_DN1660_c0_g1~~TRINITY_DN1660_c0_g1_i1.p1  ORF type:complete len:738 (+),score=273.26 TRINITY_DN1660_c0_g1_i1:51-2264(+)
MRIPTSVVGVTTMASLVAVSSVLVFEITKKHAEDSIDEISKKFADAKMESAISEIRTKLQQEPVNAITAAKSDIEAGFLRFDDIEAWVRRGSHFFKESEFFCLFMALAGNRALGEKYGLGLIVDTATDNVVKNDPPYIHMMRPYYPENASYSNTVVATAPLNLSSRAYVSTFTTGDNHVQYLLDNTPRWTDMIISMNPNIPNGGGPFITLSMPVFLTPTPNPEDFIGITAVGIYLTYFTLDPYLLSNESYLLLLDDLGMLVSSTAAEKIYYVNGTLTNGVGNYKRHTLLTSGVPVYTSLYHALPNLTAMEDGTQYFSTFYHDGDKQWLEIRTVYHSNLRCYLIGIIPESEFFQRIYDSNRKTLTIVVALIVSSTVIAAIATFSFTLSLTRLALAFDQLGTLELDHVDIHKVRKSHILYELNSLFKGFWTAVAMVRQVKAFLPDVEAPLSEESASDSKPTTDHGTRSESRSATSAKNSYSVPLPKNAMFSLGLRTSMHAVSMTVNIRNFTSMCQTSVEDAVATHKRVFALTAEEVKSHKGMVSYLEGNRIVLTWNTTRQCATSTSKLCCAAMGLELHQAVRDMASVDIGMHLGYAFHGILGSAQQRFNVVGSDLVDVSTQLAMLARKLELSPAVLASEQTVDGIHEITTNMVDDVETYAGRVKVHWLRAKVRAVEEEWMYQLSSRESNRDPFLDHFWSARRKGDTLKALDELAKFEQAHPNLAKLARYLRATAGSTAD